jgi:hypothetical protein
MANRGIARLAIISSSDPGKPKKLPEWSTKMLLTNLTPGGRST